MMNEYTQLNVLKVLQSLFTDDDINITSSVRLHITHMIDGVTSSHFGLYGRGFDSFKKLRSFLRRDIY